MVHKKQTVNMQSPGRELKSNSYSNAIEPIELTKYKLTKNEQLHNAKQ